MIRPPKIISYLLFSAQSRLLVPRRYLQVPRWCFFTFRSWLLEFRLLLTLRSWLLALQSWLLDFFYPKSCISCRKDDEMLCIRCFQKIQNIRFQECPVCRRRSHGGIVCQPFCKKFTSLDALIVSSLYQKNDILSKALHLFKYRFSEELGAVLSSLLINAFHSHFSFSSTRLRWIIVPLPLHPSRLRWRGFNQSAVLAKHVSTSLSLPFSPLLKRIRDGPSHALLSRKERMIPFDSVFEIDYSAFNDSTLDRSMFDRLKYDQSKPYRSVLDPLGLDESVHDNSTLSSQNIESKEVLNSDSSSWHISPLLPENVILVDDVATTLSTLNAASHALKSAGAQKICGLVLGRGSFY